MASKERKENRVEATMTRAMEGVESDPPDHLAHQVTPSLARQALQDHLVFQEEATMANLDRQVHPDLQDHLCPEFTGAHRLSIFLDHLDLLGRLDYLDTPQG